jgi:hypothetical protein
LKEPIKNRRIGGLVFLFRTLSFIKSLLPDLLFQFKAL